MLEHTPSLFDFCAEIHHRIIETHKTINKPVRRVALWQAVLMEKVPDSKTTTPGALQPLDAIRSANRKAGL